MGREHIKPYEFKEGHKLATGRPKGTKNLSTYLKLALTESMTYKGLKRPIAEVIILELIAKAVKSKSAKTQLAAISEILDRTEGKPIASNIQLSLDACTQDDNVDLSKLSSDELDTLIELTKKAGIDDTEIIEA